MFRMKAYNEWKDRITLRINKNCKKEIKKFTKMKNNKT
jgi:hypothetical protein